MKRSLLITLAVVIVLLIVAVWVYLMLFGSPKNTGDVFANFGFGSTARSDVPTGTTTPSTPEPAYTVDVSQERLAQLTTRAVAGFIGTTTQGVPHVRYAEVGTGHIYDINLANGEETLLSRTTIPRIQNAYFAPNATVVALEAYDGYQESGFFGVINEVTQTIDGIDLPPNSNNLTVTAQNRARFVRSQSDGSIGYESKLDGSLSEIFRIPFQSVSMLWSADGDRLYNRPDKSLMGFLYELTTTQMTATAISGYGLVVADLGSFLGYTYYSGDALTSLLVDKTYANPKTSPIVLLPEKCSMTTTLVWCGAPITKNLNITDWYKGLTTSSDYLWEIDPDTTVATLAVDLRASAGRTIDISDLAVHPDSKNILFTNKLDGTLWRFLTD